MRKEGYKYYKAELCNARSVDVGGGYFDSGFLNCLPSNYGNDYDGRYYMIVEENVKLFGKLSYNDVITGELVYDEWKCNRNHVKIPSDALKFSYIWPVTAIEVANQLKYFEDPKVMKKYLDEIQYVKQHDLRMDKLRHKNDKDIMEAEQYISQFKKTRK